MRTRMSPANSDGESATEMFWQTGQRSSLAISRVSCSSPCAEASVGAASTSQARASIPTTTRRVAISENIAAWPRDPTLV